jgi:hypothetical protein
MPKALKLGLLGLALVGCLVSGALVVNWRMKQKQAVGDYLVESEKSGETVLTAQAESWDDKGLVLAITWDDKDQTKFEWRVDFNKTVIMIPSDTGGEIPLVNRNSPQFKKAFCQGDKLEIEISEFSLGKKVTEITGDDIKFIRNLGPRKC